MIKYILPIFLLLFIGCNGTSTPSNSKPVAEIVAISTTVDTLSTVIFDALPSTDSDGQVKKYTWLDKNNNPVGDKRKYTWTTASTAGVENFTLVVTDDKGATGSKAIMITVLNQAPIAKIVASANSVPLGGSVVLDANTSVDNDGTITSYTWKDQNNQTTSAKILNWTAPSSEGTYTITLTVMDNVGETSSKSFVINVTNQAPTASIQASVNPVTVGQTVTLSGVASQDSDGTIQTYEWLDGSNQSLGMGTTYSGLSTAVAGNYTVKLRVTDNGGKSDITTIMIVVNDVPSGTFAAIQNVISAGSATYICVGDSTRAVYAGSGPDYDGEHVFASVSSALNTHGVTSLLRARVSHEAKQFNKLTATQQSPTWDEIVALIPGNGSTTIVDISLGINDLWSEGNNYGAEVADIKKDIKEAIEKIQVQKISTHFMLTMPNPKEPGAASAVAQSNLLKTVYQELSSEMNLPLVDVQGEINFIADMYQNDVVHFHLTPAAQGQVADLIKSKILP